MSLEKSELKCIVYNDIGASIEDFYEKANEEVHLAKGANSGLIQVVKKIEALYEHIDKDMDQGKLSDIDGPLMMAKKIKDYIQRVVVIVQSDALSFEQRRLMAVGRQSAFSDSMKMTKKLYTGESNKLKAMIETLSKEEDAGLIEQDKRHSRPVGTRPGNSLKQRREVEERNKSLTGKTIAKPSMKKMKVRKLAQDGKDT